MLAGGIGGGDLPDAIVSVEKQIRIVSHPNVSVTESAIEIGDESVSVSVTWTASESSQNVHAGVA